MAIQSVSLDKAPLPLGGMPRSAPIPGSIVQANLMSTTSLAQDCFIHQKFSGKLQAYMIGYVNNVYSYYSVYK